jgi:hypothetical protein
LPEEIDTAFTPALTGGIDIALTAPNVLTGGIDTALPAPNVLTGGIDIPGPNAVASIGLTDWSNIFC